MKRVLRKVAASAPISRLCTPLTAGRVCIFTLHRFANSGQRLPGHDLTLLRQTLEWLRRERYHLLGLPDALKRLRDRSTRIRRAVAFTVDDGYADFQEAAEVFLAYDCPVSLFVSTGFVDGRLWHWWDQIEFILLSTQESPINISIGGTRLCLELGDEDQRWRAIRLLWDRCKAISERDKWSSIAEIASLARVSLPANAPEQYRAMTWNDLRALETRGVHVGPHTVSHPILAKTSPRDSAAEIEQSWATVKQHLRNAMPIFAYPNGSVGDYGPREVEILRRCSLDAAVTTIPQYANGTVLDTSPNARYEIPRFPYPEDPDRVHFIVSGLSRITNFLRGV